MRRMMRMMMMIVTTTTSLLKTIDHTKSLILLLLKQLITLLRHGFHQKTCTVLVISFASNPRFQAKQGLTRAGIFTYTPSQI